MELMIKIQKAEIIRDAYSIDKIFLTLNKPSSMPKIHNESLIVSFVADYGTGENYIRANFGEIPIEVIDLTKISGEF